ncbi:MAG: OmpA family protein [Rhizobiaceae bacterium]
MSRNYQGTSLLVASIVMIGVNAGIPQSSTQVFAAELNQQAIVDKLQRKKPATRSLTKTRSFGSGSASSSSAEAMSSDEKGFLGSLGKTRGIKFNLQKTEATQDYKKPTYDAKEITKIGAIVKKYDLPTLDFKIEFEFGSAEISGSSISQVVELAKALQHPSLQGTRIILGGHTDAKGSDAFNQILSQKRSDSVARLVAQIGGIDAARLVPVGFGEHKLKNTFDPNAAENRRVEVINITSY